MKFLYQSEIEEKAWNAFVVSNSGGFLQSWQWGEFQETIGHRVARAAVVDGDAIVLCANIITHALPARKHYLYIPYGPVMARGAANARDVFAFFTQGVREKAANKNTIFVKAEPDEHFPFDMRSAGFIKSEKSVQATETMVMDLALSESDLLARMKQKTRYNIKLAGRKGVRVVSIADEHEAKRLFQDMLADTARRNGFRMHPQKHYQELMKLFLDADMRPRDFAVRLLFACHKKEVLAVALVGFFGNRATYLHGASSEKHREFMAPYLLHWEIMRAAKHMGCAEYDLWGIVTERTPKDQREKWDGFSRFKQGFAGRVVEYPGAHDLVLKRMWYNAYRIGRTVMSKSKIQMPNQ